jgi:predicted small secreted protein
MKKLIAIVFAVCALSVFLSGCNKGEDAGAADKGTDKAATTGDTGK